MRKIKAGIVFLRHSSFWYIAPFLYLYFLYIDFSDSGIIPAIFIFIFRFTVAGIHILFIRIIFSFFIVFRTLRFLVRLHFITATDFIRIIFRQKFLVFILIILHYPFRPGLLAVAERRYP